MANNIVILPKIGPVKWVRQGYTNPAVYRATRFEQFKYQDTVRTWQEKANWFQPWTTADTVVVQLQSNFAPFVLEVVTCDGIVVDSTTVDYIATSIEASGLRVYQKSYALAALDPGAYYFRLKCGSPLLVTYESEYFEIGTWEDSLLMEYSHGENDFDVIWETGIVMNYRIPGGLADYQPGSDTTVFVDQDQDLIQLSARTFEVWRLVVGTSEGVPDWVAERVNNIFQCSRVLIDGIQYTRNDGAAMEATREDEYPLVGWSMEIRPTNASGAIIDSITPEDNPSSIVYNIDNRGFGPITTTGTITPIKAIE